ncbi:unnamed protein product, partial [Bubo scandiacus]
MRISKDDAISFNEKRVNVQIPILNNLESGKCEWEFPKVKEQTGYEKRLPWVSQVQSRVSLQLMCIRSWTSISPMAVLNK